MPRGLTSRPLASQERVRTRRRVDEASPVAWLRLDWPSAEGPDPMLCRPEAPAAGPPPGPPTPPSLQRTSKLDCDAWRRQHRLFSYFYFWF